jgi:hypothetical protein
MPMVTILFTTLFPQSSNYKLTKHVVNGLNIIITLVLQREIMHGWKVWEGSFLIQKEGRNQHLLGDYEIQPIINLNPMLCFKAFSL